MNKCSELSIHRVTNSIVSGPAEPYTSDRSGFFFFFLPDSSYLQVVLDV